MATMSNVVDQIKNKYEQNVPAMSTMTKIAKLLKKIICANIVRVIIQYGPYPVLHSLKNRVYANTR